MAKGTDEYLRILQLLKAAFGKCTPLWVSNRREKHGVTLTDKEAMILGALTQAADVPFDPRKRVYLYSEAAHPSGNGRNPVFTAPQDLQRTTSPLTTKEAKMFDNLLIKILEKLADEIGGKMASLVLDEKSWSKRSSFDLYHSLRDLESIVQDAEMRLNHECSKAGIKESPPNWLDRRLFDDHFVSRFKASLEGAQNAFSKIDDKIDIYMSRQEMEMLESLIGFDRDVMYVILRDYDKERYGLKQWTELIRQTLKCAKKAREIISKFIADNFPI